MTGALCRAAGLDACVAGNIAPPVLDALMQREDSGAPPDVWVLELSSFQLETTYSLNATAGVVLNLSQDHCDRYHGMEDYAAAKARVFRGTGIQIVNRDDPLSRSMAKPGRRAFTFGLGEPELKGDWGIAERAGRAWLAENGDRLMAVDELQIAGPQNAANALAALALCRAIDLPYAPLVDGLRAFRSLPHRVEHVAEIDGVVFFDDSKGTNVGATVAALAGIGRPTVLIAGGDGKGQDFTPLAGRWRPRARRRAARPRRSGDRARAGRDRRPTLAATDPRGRGQPRARRGAARRCGAAFASLRELRHVSQLRAQGPGIRGRGAPWRWRPSGPERRRAVLLAEADRPMARRAARRPEHDPALVWSALALLLIGLVMVYSSSIALPRRASTRATRHAFPAPASALPRDRACRRRHCVQVPLATGSALAVPVPGRRDGADSRADPRGGAEVIGARRWIPMGFVNLQPSELMKLFVVLYAADYTVRKQAHGELPKGFMPMFAAMLATGAAAAGAGLRRVCGHHVDRDGRAVPGRDELAALRGTDRDAGGRLRR